MDELQASQNQSCDEENYEQEYLNRTTECLKECPASMFMCSYVCVCVCVWVCVKRVGMWVCAYVQMCVFEPIFVFSLEEDR